MPADLSFACLCGAIAGSLAARPPQPQEDGGDCTLTSKNVIPLTLCHCSICRHTSGVLCTSYCPVEAVNDTVLTAKLTGYSSSAGTTRYFCKTCGCHMFRSRQGEAEATSPPSPILWEIATGVISAEQHHDDGSGKVVLQFARHAHVDDTGDGGLAVWMPTVGGRPMDGAPSAQTRCLTETPTYDSNASWTASCHCGTVRLHIHPPQLDMATSRRPHSGFPDLTHAYATTDSALVKNPDNVKWWLRPGKSTQTNTRYLAGTCACRTCRLSTGFEIQTWAFVPRANIFLEEQAPETLNFMAPHSLATYGSSPGIERNFCPRCGATVFWHDIWRPDLIDVSAGLLQDQNGARAEALLDWWKGRVSFAEDSTCGRHGVTAARAAELVDSLESGMRAAEGDTDT